MNKEPFNHGKPNNQQPHSLWFHHQSPTCSPQFISCMCFMCFISYSMISHYVAIYGWRDSNDQYDALKLHIIWKLSYLKTAMVVCNSAANNCWIFPKDHSKPSAVNFDLSKQNNISFWGVPCFVGKVTCFFRGRRSGLTITPLHFSTRKLAHTVDSDWKYAIIKNQKMLGQQKARSCLVFLCDIYLDLPCFNARMSLLALRGTVRQQVLLLSISNRDVGFLHHKIWLKYCK